METILLLSMCASFTGEDKCLADWFPYSTPEACEVAIPEIAYNTYNMTIEAGGEPFWVYAECHQVKKDAPA